MRFFWLWLMVLLVGCVPQPTKKPEAKIDVTTMTQQLIQLPGVSIPTGQPISFSYPEQVMFGTGAVLPMPGGPKLLEPLAEFLKQNPGAKWDVVVRAQTIHGVEYDQALAEKRSELLASYLLSKGVELGRLSFQPDTADGDPLVFTLSLPTRTDNN